MTIKQMDIKNCTFILRDGTSPTPNELELKIDEGNVTWTERRNLEAKKDRGILDYIKEGDEENMTVSVEARFDAIVSSSGLTVTVHEFLTFTGAAAAYVTTGDVCAAKCVDLIVKVSQTCGTVEDEIITFPDFTYEEIGGDFRAGTMSFSGICNAKRPTSVRSTFP